MLDPLHYDVIYLSELEQIFQETSNFHVQHIVIYVIRKLKTFMNVLSHVINRFITKSHFVKVHSYNFKIYY